MQSHDDGSTRRLSNIFLRAFLDRLRNSNEPAGSAEAAKAGPWRVSEIPATYYGVYDAGDRPYALYNDLYPALLTAALLPGTGREPLFQLHKDPDTEGYAVESGGEVIGHLACFDDKLVDALHVVECLLRSPEALANLLEAAGGAVLERAGAILSRRLAE